MYSAALAAPDLFTCLRAATAQAHTRLESSLNLLEQPLARDRFVAVLKRFYGFHAAWEQSLVRFPEIRAAMRTRVKTLHLERDLLALGIGDFETIPRCAAAHTLAVNTAEAVGVFYVLEGSTLGGKVISTALSAAPWLPPGGLTYFNPYGPHTGAMWQSFRHWARTMVTGTTQGDAERAAVNTFKLLTHWLPGLPETEAA